MTILTKDVRRRNHVSSESCCFQIFLQVSGLPTPDLIWQLNGQTIRPDSAHKMLVRENGVHSLVIEPVTSHDAGIYTCIASNRAGQNSFNLELIVAGKREAERSNAHVLLLGCSHVTQMTRETQMRGRSITKQ